MRSRRGPERSETSGSRGGGSASRYPRPTRPERSRSESERWRGGRTDGRPRPPAFVGTALVPGPDIRFGIHPVEEALRAGNVRRVFLERGYQERPRLAAIAELAYANGVDVAELDAAALTLRASADRHQGALAEVRPFRYLTLDELLSRAESQDE